MCKFSRESTWETLDYAARETYRLARNRSRISVCSLNRHWLDRKPFSAARNVGRRKSAVRKFTSDRLACALGLGLGPLISGIQAKLKQPKADFAAIAKESSDQKDSAARGGDIGWVAESQVRPEIKSQVVGLAKGAVGEPVKLSDGWHIVKLLDTKPAATRPLDDVRPLLIQRLRAQRTEVLRRSYLARLLEESPPVINELALSKIFGPAPEKQSQAAPQAKAK